MTISKKDKQEIIRNIFNGLEEYWIDESGVIFATNLEAITITGYEESEIIGKHFSILYTEEDVLKNLPESDLQGAFKNGTYKVSTILLKKNKIKFLAKINFEVVQPNKIQHVRITVQDKTYKSVQKNKMKRLESHFNSLFHNHFVGVLNLQQADQKIVLANVKACEILGEYDSIGKSFNHYIKNEKSISTFLEMIAKESPNDFELELTQQSGVIRWVSVSHSIFPSESIIEILLFDITEEKKRIEALERINQQLDQFVYHISHDLRSPISTLLGLIDLSQKESCSWETIHEYLKMMMDRARHLDGILRDLTSLAMNEKTSLDLDEIQFEREIESVVSQCTDADSASKIAIQLFINQSHSFVTDMKRVKVILRNIISNSIKYYNPGQLNPYIKISAVVNEARATIEVEDNGIGINQKHIAKIYDMFFRATDRSSGSGLGLHIVKSMLDKLNGTITLTSYQDKGTSFKIVLPNMNNTFAAYKEKESITNGASV